MSPKEASTHVRLTAEEREALKTESIRVGMSVGGYVRQLIRRAIGLSTVESEKETKR